MGLLDPPPPSRLKLNTRSLLERLQPADLVTPAVHAAPPTITYGSSRTVTARMHYPMPPGVANLGPVPVWDSVTAKAQTGNSSVGLDFYLTGDTVEFGWVSQSTNTEATWIWVEGQPCTAAPALPLSTTSGTQYFGKLVFGSVARRRITIYAGNINAWLALSTPATASLTPASRSARIAFVGDSFTDQAGSSGSNPLYSYPPIAARALGVECLQLGIGGTGWNTAQPYDLTSRITSAVNARVDGVCFLGSVNDGTSGLTAAVTRCLDAWAAALPNIPFIVIGPQPTSATGTIASSRQLQVAGVKAAAITHPQVIAFYDMCGHASALPSAYSGGTFYNEGDLVTYQGSVWKWSNAGVASGAPAGTPGTVSRWALMTWDYTGTGTAGATTGDGTRDIFLGADGIHPTAAAAEVLGLRVAAAWRDALTAYAA